MPFHILCVDDEEFNLDILETYLSESGYGVDLAEDGKSALKALEDHPGKYSAVLLDRMMPDMDGIEVLRKLRSSHEFDGLPVIMQTAKASNEDIQEGLHAGAHYYLTKPYSKDTLLAIVKTAVNDHRRLVEVQEEAKNTNTALRMMKKAQFVFRTSEDVHRLSPLIANATERAEIISVGLIELMMNAVEHGNLAISYDDKTRLLAEKAFEQEVQNRLEDETYGAREATLIFERHENEIQIEIIDQGEGFDWRKYLDFDPERAFHTHGRGIMMAREFSFDSLEYKGDGNHVVVKILLT